MKITPVGIYGPYPKEGGATSCYLVECEKTRVALDFGSGSLSRLQHFIDPLKLDAIVLSHLHFDHFCDVLTLTYMLEEGMKIYCPATPTDCFSLIKNRKVFDVGVIDRGSRITVGALSFEFEKVSHPVESYAVKVTGGGGSFVYTGDTMEIGRLPEFSNDCKFIICDCAGAPGSPHLTPEGGESLMKASGVPVIMTHLNPGYDVRAKAERLGIKVIIADEPLIV